MRQFTVIFKAIGLLLYSVFLYNFTRLLSAHIRSAVRYRAMVKGARSLAKFFEMKRGVFLKTAQYLASVSNLFAADFSEILSRVSIRQKQQSYRYIKHRIEQEFKKPISEIFSSFQEQPIATASFGQVHKATLKDGRQVAVKVLHKNMEVILRKDLQALRKVVILIRFFYPKLDFLSHWREFAYMAQQEIDYLNEAENIRRAHYHFAKQQRILIPNVIEEYSCPTVLCTEYVDGISLQELLHQIKKGDKKHQLSATTRKKIIDTLLFIYKKMIFDDQFYHADPHPGNIFLLYKDNESLSINGDRLALIDFGASLDLSRVTLNRLREFIELLQTHDIAGLVDLGIVMGVFNPNIDRDKYIDLIEIIHTRFSAFRLDHFHRINPLRLGQIIRVRDLSIVDLQLRDLLAELRMPRKYIYLARTISLLFSNAYNIDKTVNVFTLSEKYFNELLKKNPKTQYMIAKSYLWRGVRKLDQLLAEPQEQSNTTFFTNARRLSHKSSSSAMIKFLYLLVFICFSAITIVFYIELQKGPVYWLWSGLIASIGALEYVILSRRQ